MRFAGCGSAEPFSGRYVWVNGDDETCSDPATTCASPAAPPPAMPAAWREIVDRFGPRIHSIAHHFTRDPERAQDLTQEIFLRLFQNLGSYRGRRARSLAWTLRLSRNLCIDDYRRRRLERTLPVPSARNRRRARRTASDPAALAQHRELLALVEATLRELDPETVLILTLRDLEGLSYRRARGPARPALRHRQVAHPPRPPRAAAPPRAAPGGGRTRRRRRPAGRARFLEVVPC